MYFWRIEALKRELAGGPLPARRALPYVVCWFSLMSLISVIPLSDSTVPWEWAAIQGLYYAIATAAGAWWSYRANGGVAGSDFPARVLAIWWVLGIRFLVILSVPLIVLYAVLTPDADSYSYLADIISALAFTVPYYWRAGVHLRDVAQANAAARTSDGVFGAGVAA